MADKLPRLRVKGAKIVDERDRPVALRGVALGGWLMMEGYMSAGRNMAERDFKASFEKALGKEALEDFTRSFRSTFIQESDIKFIKEWGANCVRVPFNYRVIEFEDKPYSFNSEGLFYLNKVVEWCEKYGLYCILDMHAAPGAQNPDWHADPSGKPELFTNEVNKSRYLRLWRFLAELYKGSSAVAGYDILNEPVVKEDEEGLVKDLYEKATKEIRDAGDRHIIFLEGNHWAQRINFLGKPADDNTAYSVHVYPPTEFTFNLVRGLRYPCKVCGIPWTRESMKMMALPYKQFAKKNNVHLYAGEFGVNARDGHYGELRWVKDVLDIFEEGGLSWTYWTYKTVANSVYPDGILRYVQNPPWVRREGPVSGWETFSSLWQKERDKMIDSWKTENFELNEKLLAVLEKYW
ncbi:MAG: glycoside hydrolase family 5 protein [Candidatus Omnitrophota bacterium]|nr:glycoside hydrolase family 5 protein [Candidatus Omnitrophota bacterium]